MQYANSIFSVKPRTAEEGPWELCKSRRVFDNFPICTTLLATSMPNLSFSQLFVRPVRSFKERNFYDFLVQSKYRAQFCEKVHTVMYQNDRVQILYRTIYTIRIFETAWNSYCQKTVIKNVKCARFLEFPFEDGTWYTIRTASKFSIDWCTRYSTFDTAWNSNSQKTVIKNEKYARFLEFTFERSTWHTVRTASKFSIDWCITPPIFVTAWNSNSQKTVIKTVKYAKFLEFTVERSTWYTVQTALKFSIDWCIRTPIFVVAWNSNSQKNIFKICKIADFCF